MRRSALLALCLGLSGMSLSASAQTARPAAQQAQPNFTTAFRNLVAQAQRRVGAAPATTPAPTDGSRPLAIDWPAAAAAQNSRLAVRSRTVNAAFVTANRARIDTVQIPVLLPGDPDLAAGLRFFPQGLDYVVSSNPPGMGFTLMGTGRAYPLGEGTSGALGKGGLASRIPADGIVIRIPGKSGRQDGDGLTASFNRFGAAYTIMLDCDDHNHDPRCIYEAYVRGVIYRLLAVLPAGRA